MTAGPAPRAAAQTTGETTARAIRASQRAQRAVHSNPRRSRFIVVQERERDLMAVPLKTYGARASTKTPTRTGQGKDLKSRSISSSTGPVRTTSDPSKFFKMGKVFSVWWDDPIATRQKQHTEPRVECKINGVTAHAFPDSGADANYISQQEAERRGCDLDKSQAGQVKTAGGRWVPTLGTVRLRFSFRDEREVHSLISHVVEACIQDLILGSPFLRLTETLSRFHHRITRVLRNINACRVTFLGAPRQRMMGALHGVPTCAVPDTGADLSLLSEEYIDKRGLVVDRSREHRILLRFADGSLGWTSGLVRNLGWQFYSSPDETHRTDFYVYDGLESDVILGYDFLCDSLAFELHSDSLQELDNDDGSSLGLFSLIKICEQKVTSAHGFGGFLNRFRRHRRGSSPQDMAPPPMTTLPNSGLSFASNSLPGYYRTERDMLRRVVAIRNSDVSSADERAAQAERLRQWQSDWDLLLAAKPHEPASGGSHGTGNMARAQTEVRQKRQLGTDGSSGSGSSMCSDRT